MYTLRRTWALSALILIGGACMAAGPTYRWVDKDGVVHYSDRPVPGAQEIELQKAPLPGTVVTPAPAPRAASASQTVFSYTSCTITTPLNDQTFNNVNSVSASLQVQPGLRPGDVIQVHMDGGVVAAWPQNSTSYFLNNLFRGTHNLMVMVRDPSGNLLCSGPSVRFHITQPSVISPARR